MGEFRSPGASELRVSEVGGGARPARRERIGANPPVEDPHVEILDAVAPIQVVKRGSLTERDAEQLPVATGGSVAGVSIQEVGPIGEGNPCQPSQVAFGDLLTGPFFHHAYPSGLKPETLGLREQEAPKNSAGLRFRRSTSFQGTPPATIELAAPALSGTGHQAAARTRAAPIHAFWATPSNYEFSLWAIKEDDLLGGARISAAVDHPDRRQLEENISRLQNSWCSYPAKAWELQEENQETSTLRLIKDGGKVRRSGKNLRESRVFSSIRL